jgi:hypothetical protein
MDGSVVTLATLLFGIAEKMKQDTTAFVPGF